MSQRHSVEATRLSVSRALADEIVALARPHSAATDMPPSTASVLPNPQWVGVLSMQLRVHQKFMVGSGPLFTKLFGGVRGDTCCI